MTGNPNLHILATHVPIEHVENLIFKQSMPQLIRYLELSKSNKKQYWEDDNNIQPLSLQKCVSSVSQ